MMGLLMRKADFAQVSEKLDKRLKGLSYHLAAHASTAHSVRTIGRIESVGPTVLKACLPGVQLGELCHVRVHNTEKVIRAEVIGIDRETAILSPFEEPLGIASGAEVERLGRRLEIELGDHLIGAVLDGFGQIVRAAPEAELKPTSSANTDRDPSEETDFDSNFDFDSDSDSDKNASLDEQPSPRKISAATELRSISVSPPGALSRPLVSDPLPLGIRAIDGLLTCGKGQRVGIFAAAGVGKSTLLGMMMQGNLADIVVLALVGERGREVREFMDRIFDEKMRSRTVIVVATSDRPALERYKASYVATTIAEYFRDQGKSVLLLVDSVTRYARAARQLGIAAGEPMAANGYPPSVFASLPRLLERAGPASCGVITGIYTVLVEADNMNEPVADEVRSILDGHIVLSRALAERNHYPAIDILRSVSRVMPQVAPEPLKQYAGKLRRLMSRYDDIDLLVRVGEYQRGHDEEADEALEKRAKIMRFLCQNAAESIELDETQAALQEVVEG